MISLDTNVVLRFLLNDVPTQTARAKALFSKPAIYVSDVVISEVAFVLEKAMMFDRANIGLMLKTLMALPNLTHNDLVLPEVITLFEARKSLSFVDCYATVEAKVFSAKLYTFDKKLINQGGAHVQAA
jgi:uncharacterized protein